MPDGLLAPDEVEALARWWWNTLRANTGGKGPEYDDASEDSKEAVRDYIRNTDA